MFDALLQTIAGGVTLSTEQVNFIQSLWTPRHYPKGQFFQRAGEVTTHGGFVVRGCLLHCATAALAARVPQRMLASYLGITPETLSRHRDADCRINRW
jgi:hypothetical protein